MLERIEWLVTSLLRLSKLDAGVIVLKTAEKSLASFFQEVMKPFAVSMAIEDKVCK